MKNFFYIILLLPFILFSQTEVKEKDKMEQYLNYINRKYPKAKYNKKRNVYADKNLIYIFIDSNGNLINTGVPTTAIENNIYKVVILTTKDILDNKNISYTFYAKGDYKPTLNIQNEMLLNQPVEFNSLNSGQTDTRQDKDIIVSIPFANVGPFTEEFEAQLTKITTKETEKVISKSSLTTQVSTNTPPSSSSKTTTNATNNTTTVTKTKIAGTTKTVKTKTTKIETKKNKEVIFQRTISIAKTYHVSLSTGIFLTTLSNPQNIKSIVKNNGDTTLIADDENNRGIISLNAVFYPKGRNFLFPPTNWKERFGFLVGTQLDKDQFENFFTGVQLDFARGGSIATGVHYGKRKTIHGLDDFNFGEDVFTGDIESFTKKEWDLGFFIGINLDIRIFGKIFNLTN